NVLDRGILADIAALELARRSMARYQRPPRAFCLGLDEERQVTAHPAVGQECQRVAYHRHDQHDRIDLRRWQLAEQRPAHNLEEIEQNVIVHDVLAAGEDMSVTPKNRRYEEGELQQIADDQLDVAKTGAHKRKQRDGPKSVDEQEQHAGKSQQRDPMQRNDPEHNGDGVEDEMMAKGDENAETHPRDVEIDAQVGRENE